MNLRQPIWDDSHCMFCGSAPLTREHIWPDWVVKLFPSGKKAWTAGAAFLEGKKRELTKFREHQQNDLTAKAKCVCEDCNSGWMSDIEGYASPLLTPLIVRPTQRPTLSIEDQCTIGAWAALRAMVFESQMPADMRYFTQQERIEFGLMRKGHIQFPRNCHVWLAAAAFLHEGAQYEATTRIAANPEQGFGVTTYLIGQAVLQVFHSRGFTSQYLTERKGLRQVRVIDRAKLSKGEWPACTFQVWPRPKRERRWPPSRLLRPEGMETFSARFRVV